MNARALAESAGARLTLHRKGLLAWLSVIGISAALILAPAVWNGFPFMFYDTGSFIDQAVEGGFVAERSAFYAWFLALFQLHLSLWPAMLAQVLMTVLVMAEFARILAPELSPRRFLAIIALLVVGTALPWFAAQVLPDILAPLLVLCIYLLGFHSAMLDWRRKATLIAVAVYAVAAHASHLGLVAGLAVIVILMQAATRRVAVISVLPRAALPVLVFVASLLLIVTSNFIRTGDVFVSRSGPAFLFARLVQDGIAQRLLDDTCPESGYRLCAYKDDMPKSANDYLWGDSPFQDMGGFIGTRVEATGMIVESLKRYPLMHLKTALLNTVDQFVSFETGDGVEPLNDVPVPAMNRHMPGQVPDYRASRQQLGLIEFKWVNALQVPVGGLSVLGLAAILVAGVRRRSWDDRIFLPAFLLLTLVGNAFICGVLSNPHDRYQSRLMWVASFGVLLLVTRRLRTPSVQTVVPYTDLVVLPAEVGAA